MSEYSVYFKDKRRLPKRIKAHNKEDVESYLFKMHNILKEKIEVIIKNE